MDVLRWSVCFAILWASSVGSFAIAAQSFDYVARIAGNSRIQGNVAAGGITWKCRGNTCTTSGPWPTPGANACHALAQQVGEITSYGHKGKSLSRSELGSCNRGIAGAIKDTETSTPTSAAIKPAGKSVAQPATPLSIGAMDKNKLQVLQTAPAVSGAVPRQTPKTPGLTGSSPSIKPSGLQSLSKGQPSSQAGSILPLDRPKMVDPGIEHDQLREIGSEKAGSLASMNRQIGSLPADQSRTLAVPALVEPLNKQAATSAQSSGKQSGTAPLDRLKGGDLAGTVQGSPKQPNSIFQLDRSKAAVTSITPALSAGKPLPAGTNRLTLPDRVTPKDTPEINTAPTVDIGKLQPLSTARIGSTNITPQPASNAGPPVKGFTPPSGGLKPPPSGLTLPGLPAPGTSLDKAGMQEKVARADLSVYQPATGPRIESLTGVSQCADSGDTVTLHGANFGPERNGRRIMLAHVGRPLAPLVVTQWSDTRITARLPTFSEPLQRAVPYHVAIRSADDRTWLSSSNPTIVGCSSAYSIWGWVNFSNNCAPTPTTLSVSRVAATKGENDAFVTQIQSGSDPVALAGQHKYQIGLKAPGNYRVRIGDPPARCAGRWESREFVVSVPRDFGSVQQNFRFLDDEQQLVSSLEFTGLTQVTLTMVNGRFCQCPRDGDGRRVCRPWAPEQCYDYTTSHEVTLSATLRSNARNCSVPNITATVRFPTREMSQQIPVGGCIEGGRTRQISAVFPGINANPAGCVWGSACRNSYIWPGDRVRIELRVGSESAWTGELTIGTAVSWRVSVYLPARYTGLVYAGTSTLSH